MRHYHTHGAAQLTLLMLLLTFSFNAFAEAEKNPALQSPTGRKKYDLRSPSNAGQTEAEVERFLKSEVCQEDEILIVPSALKLEQKDSFDRMFACSSTCSIRGCTYYLYLSSEKNRLRSGGLIDGLCETLPKSDNGYKQIRCVSQSAEQKTETVWRYDGQQYR